MILDEIIANKRAELAELKRRVSADECRRRAEAAGPARDFAGALCTNHVALIAEVKRASPSRGALCPAVDPGGLARVYAENGAAAISVLTDRKYFRGSLDDLDAVRSEIDLPILRKDFVVDEYQIYEARAHGADAVLLIVRVLSDAQLGEYGALARSLGMGALVEVHAEDELDRALTAGARVVGINNRNLADMTVDLAVTERIAPRIPSGTVIVAESGVFTRSDIERAAKAGAHAVLVGEGLVRAPDVSAKVCELATVPRVAE